MKKLDIIMKYCSLIFLGICVILAVFIFANKYYDTQIVILRNDREVLQRVSNNLAVTLSQLNGMLPNDSAIIGQIDDVLRRNGYEQLARNSLENQK